MSSGSLLVEHLDEFLFPILEVERDEGEGQVFRGVGELRDHGLGRLMKGRSCLQCLSWLAVDLKESGSGDDVSEDSAGMNVQTRLLARSQSNLAYINACDARIIQLGGEKRLALDRRLIHPNASAGVSGCYFCSAR